MKATRRVQHPLSVDLVVRGYGAVVAVFSKGHHSEAEFYAAAAAREDVPATEEELKAKDFWHEYWRVAPSPNGIGPSVYYPASEGRGAFPVTVVYL